MGPDHKPPEMNAAGPKHGKWDGKQHMGGNQFAGGSGGRTSSPSSQAQRCHASRAAGSPETPPPRA